MTGTVARSGGLVGMALFTAAMLAVLTGLGFWQLQRRVEKHGLITMLAERLNAEPVALPPPSRWDTLSAERDEFRRVAFAATYQTAPEARVYSSGSAIRPDVTSPGFFVFAVAATGSGQRIVIDRGFVPEGRTAEDPQPATVQLTGYLRFPEQPGWLTPAPDPAKRLWFARDAAGMARALAWGQVAPFYIDLETPAPASGWPRPGRLDVHLKDDHLQYAITWFGLALAVAVAFLAWVRVYRKDRASL